MPKLLPEVFVSKALLASEVSRRMKRGTLRKLGSRVYTTNLKEKPEILLRRHVWKVVGALFPGALVVDRTAFEHCPAKDGSVFIVSNKKRGITLPGLSVHPRKGEGPLPDDRPFMEGLYLSSPARAYLENMRRSRLRKGGVARTLPRKEVEEKLETLLQVAGTEALQRLRDEVRHIASALGMEQEAATFDSLVGTLLGTRQAPMTSPLAVARVQGVPYDAKRLDLFQKLYEALSITYPAVRIMAKPGPALPFFEAYFSNFIEGTEFDVDEASRIIFEGEIPKDRPADAYDILGTYAITSDIQEMQKIPRNGDELIALLKSRHQHLMQGRPEMQPGKFKTVGNRAGATLFVEPSLVEGTLRQGFQWMQGIQSPFLRAVYMMFLVAEVHPFADGNGRCARLMMNAELVAGKEARIIIPTIFRGNYLAALRALSHNQQVEPLVRVLDFAQNYTSRIDWSDPKKARQILTDTHAFDDPNQADLSGVRLTLPL